MRWKAVQRGRAKDCGSFNSLFEMRGATTGATWTYTRTAFNSLFEMLRGRRVRAQDAGHPPFNSLFEMPALLKVQTTFLFI